MLQPVNILALIALLAADAQAQPAVEGVVTVQTVTIAGQDFSQAFLAAWRDLEDSEHYTLAVRERPSARYGSEVWVEAAQRRVFQTRLPPTRAALRGIAERAAEQVWSTLRQDDIGRKLARDADLAPDEF